MYIYISDQDVLARVGLHNPNKSTKVTKLANPYCSPLLCCYISSGDPSSFFFFVDKTWD